MAIITEVMAPDEVALVARVRRHLADRHAQYAELPPAGSGGPAAIKPVLLKRGMSSTIEELLLAAEYILSQGNTQVMLCERGIRTFEKATRYTFDVNAIPVLKTLTHLPVIADPSHGTGRWDLVHADQPGGGGGGGRRPDRRGPSATPRRPCPTARNRLRPGEAAELIAQPARHCRRYRTGDVRSRTEV